MSAAHTRIVGQAQTKSPNQEELIWTVFELNEFTKVGQSRSHCYPWAPWALAVLNQARLDLL